MKFLNSLFGRHDSAQAVVPAAVDFMVVDVETATRDRHSICQVGIVGFSDGVEIFADELLVDPGCAFEMSNISIHGITAERVRGAPNFRSAHGRVSGHLSTRVVVSHSTFDRQSLEAACGTHQMKPIECRWIDSVVVARAAWPDLADHKLRTLADHLGYAFHHHDALHDARAAGHVMLRAMEVTGRGLEDWLGWRPARPVMNKPSLMRAGVEIGPLAGEVIAITGDVAGTKAEFADRLQAAGASVNSSPGRKTTILVLGVQDPATFAGKAKSAKHLKAEELIAAGQSIRILTEGEVLKLLA